MKYTMLALLVVSTACSKKDAQESPRADDMAEATLTGGSDASEQDAPPEPPAAGRPVVELIDAGSPPLQELRWELETGAQQVLEMESAYTFEAKADGYEGATRSQVRRVLPAMVQTIQLVVDDMPADGPAQVTFEVTKDRVLDTSDANADLWVTPATGTKGSFQVDSLGVLSDFELIASSALPEGVDLEYVENLLRLIVFPVPDEPVGIGAEWDVSRAVERRGILTNEQVHIELEELSGSEVTVNFRLESHGSRQETIGTGQHEAVRTQNLRWGAEGRTKVRLTSLAPILLKLENDVALASQVARPTGAVEKLDMRVDRRVEMRPESPESDETKD